MIRKNSTAVKCLKVGAVTAFAIGVSSWALAEQSIRSVTGSLQGTSEILRVELSEPLASLPTGFSTQTPARIALDFPGAANASGKNFVDINNPFLVAGNNCPRSAYYG